MWFSPHPLRRNDRGKQILLQWNCLPHQHGAHPHLRRLSREEGFSIEESAGSWKVLRK